MKPGVVVVDSTLGFTDPRYDTGADLTDQVRATARLLDAARERGLFVAFTTISYDSDAEGLPWVNKAPGMLALRSGSALVDVAGRWDHWPSGFVFTGGRDDGVEGKIVLSPGDVLLPFNSYVQRPVEITIEKGFITDIRGDLDAQMLKSYIESFEDPRGYGMSHVGWGLNDLAQWHGMLPPAFAGGMGMEPRAVYGNVMFSIGPNNELGGPNDTACASTSRCGTAASSSTTSPSWSTVTWSSRRCSRCHGAAEPSALRSQAGPGWFQPGPAFCLRGPLAKPTPRLLLQHLYGW
jgi:hypothetical protein